MSESTAAYTLENGLRELLDRHGSLLREALSALSTRVYWAAYEEDRDSYGPDAAARAADAFRGLLGQHFALDQPGEDGMVGPDPESGGETSPFGFPLRISYPHADPDVLLPAMVEAARPWAVLSPWLRAAVCAEILARINARSHEIALTATHTSGQGELMAFHAGAVHAQDRGLEAVAQVLGEQTRLPERVVWRKPTAAGEEVQVKEFTVVPREVGLVVAGRVVPAWSAYPGLFASLAAGSAVLVKPHPDAVLPLALTVRIARGVLREYGLCPDTVCLAPELPGEGLARDLALRPGVGVVDYTGSAPFGTWLEENVRPGTTVLASNGAVNSVLVDSTDDYRGMVANLAFTLALYSGRLCTAPQNLFVPERGIDTDEGHKDLSTLVTDLGAEVAVLLGRGGEAAELLGALPDAESVRAWEEAASGRMGEVLFTGPETTHPDHRGAAVRPPVAVLVAPGSPPLYREHPAPILFVVPVLSAEVALESVQDIALTSGSFVLGVHTAREGVEREAEAAARACGVGVSLNLTGSWLMTQSSVFSDLHGSGLNPASNFGGSRGVFATTRFSVTGVRRSVGSAEADQVVAADDVQELHP
ncbi:aldehyde dehydrogenase family protein [Nocardiopsis quinghaiensis]|uniref:aldehyde dehydrogenase family protein n=1 Tax=Nocardiopsis quinghaiensis TaxID=464995 RepID=UPI00123888B7|nr:aldehyde dehydrogenase family protein [Nocardiopsis quinghaiensis]